MAIVSMACKNTAKAEEGGVLAAEVLPDALPKFHGSQDNAETAAVESESRDREDAHRPRSEDFSRLELELARSRFAKGEGI